MSNKLAKKQEKLEILKGENPKFYEYLHGKNDADSTFMKYQVVVRGFIKWLSDRNKTIDTFEKCDAIDFSKYLEANEKCTSTCNNKITIVNVYLQSIGKSSLFVPSISVVEKDYISDERYIFRKDFEKLKMKAKEDIELDAILNTFAGTGIRVSELEFFTYESVKKGEIEIYNKKKKRCVVLPHKLKIKLLDYCRRKNIKTGYIFTADGKNPYDRCTIWKKLKKLAKDAGVLLTKVFPHALRHFYAVCHYKIYKNIEILKTILGHSRITTTLIYLKKTLSEYAKNVDVRLID